MRKRILQRNGAAGLNETMLFHGTGSSYVDAICKNNFDWRLCGKHGTAFGQGTAHSRLVSPFIGVFETLK